MNIHIFIPSYKNLESFKDDDGSQSSGSWYIYIYNLIIQRYSGNTSDKDKRRQKVECRVRRIYGIQTATAKKIL